VIVLLDPGSDVSVRCEVIKLSEGGEACYVCWYISDCADDGCRTCLVYVSEKSISPWRCLGSSWAYQHDVLRISQIATLVLYST
jgi:hypothetical protein